MQLSAWNASWMNGPHFGVVNSKATFCQSPDGPAALLLHSASFWPECGDHW